MENKPSVLTDRYEVGRLLGQSVGLTEQIKRAVSVMRIVKHPNVVKLYEVMATKLRIYFVIEDLRPALGDIIWVWQGEKEKDEQVNSWFAG